MGGQLTAAAAAIKDKGILSGQRIEHREVATWRGRGESLASSNRSPMVGCWPRCASG
jgi:hypothetical protein